MVNNQITPPLDPQVQQSAQAALSILESADCTLQTGNKSVPLHGYFLALLKQAMREALAGHTVTLLADQSSLTTKQAADLLNVSRPFLTKLLKNGESAYEMRGAHHRVNVCEILRYKQQRSEQRLEGIRALSALSVEYGLPD
jgi:excisionase family DNA binding protein